MPHTRSALTAACVVAACAGVLMFADDPPATAAVPPPLASTYTGTAHNTPFNTTAPFTLTGITVDAQGNFTGQFNVMPPLYGSGPFGGTYRNGTIVFTIASTQPNPCTCTTIVVTGTVDAQGTISASYTAVTAGGSQAGTLQATPTAPAPTPATPTAPAAALPPAFGTGGVFTLPSNHACVSRRHFRIRIRRQRGGVTLVSAAVAVNGRRVALRKGRRLTAAVDLRGLPKGRFTVRISALTSDGRAITGTRRYRTCAPRRASNGPGPVVLAAPA